MVVYYPNYSRERYQRRKAAGICHRCSAKAKKGLVHCAKCNEYQKAKEKARRDKRVRLCPDCGKKRLEPGRRVCPKCLYARYIARTKKVNDERYAQRKAAGLCGRCGIVKTKGTAYCPKCIAKFNEATLKKRAEAISQGLCGRCRRRKHKKNKTLCGPCQIRQKEISAASHARRKARLLKLAKNKKKKRRV